MAGDVFIWTLERLGPDFWQSIAENAMHLTLCRCLFNERQEHMRRLLQLCGRRIDARDVVDGYSPLHKSILYGLDPSCLLILGANVNLLGSNPEHSPRDETPLSLSMYRANTFLDLQKALKGCGAKIETVVGQGLEGRPFQYSCWTKKTLIELYSQDLDFSFLRRHHGHVCPYCSHHRLLMLQPYWMRILDLITRRKESGSVRDVVQTILSTKAQTEAVSRGKDTKEKRYLHVRTQDRDNAEPRMEAQDHFAHDDMPASIRPEGEAVEGCKFYDSISIDDEDICIFCWQKWRNTGIKPPLDESECACCGRALSSTECRGRGHNNELYCQYCSAKQAQAAFAAEQRQKRSPAAEIVSDEEQDDYSPYLLHT